MSLIGKIKIYLFEVLRTLGQALDYDLSTVKIDFYFRTISFQIEEMNIF